MEREIALPSLPMLGEGRAERSDAARNRLAILDAAERLVAENGAAAVTMDGVACAAHVGKGTLFRHFGDRAGLLHSLLDERERAFQEELIRGPAPLGPAAPADVRLAAFGEHVLAHIERQGDLVAASEHGVIGQRLMHSVYAAYRTFIVGRLLDAGRSSPSEAGYFADVLLAALSAELVLHQRRNLGMSQEQLARCWRELVAAVLASG